MLPVDRNVESAAKMSVASRATPPPLRVQPRDDALEREPAPFLKSPFAYAVVCTRRLRVAVGTQANYGVVGCIMLIPPSESRDSPSRNAARDACGQCRRKPPLFLMLVEDNPTVRRSSYRCVIKCRLRHGQPRRWRGGTTEPSPLPYAGCC